MDWNGERNFVITCTLRIVYAENNILIYIPEMLF